MFLKKLLFPKGMKGIYVEPFSKYWYNKYYGIKPSQYAVKWEGKYHLGFVSDEAEIISYIVKEFDISEISLLPVKLM